MNITIKEILKKSGLKIKNLRKNENLSQSVLAEKIGITRLTISKIEKGKNTSVINLYKLFKYFNVLDDLSIFYDTINSDKEEIISLYED